ncbi:MAG: uridine kinase [Kiritimatiellia bacterium]|jgi:uridine kinase
MTNNESNVQDTDLVHIKLTSGGELEVARLTRVCDILPPEEEGLPWLGALVNNDICSCSYPIDMNCTVEFLNASHRYGAQIYRRSMSFLLAKAVQDLFPEAFFAVEHSLGTGYYCRFEHPDKSGLSKQEFDALEAHLRHLIASKIRIQRKNVSFEEAYRELEREQQIDKLNLLRFRNPPRITMWRCEDFSDAGHGVIAPSTHCLDTFTLIDHDPGFVLQFPVWNAERKVREMPAYERQPHLFEIFQEHKKWGEIIGIRTVGDLNAAVANHSLDDLVKTSEAFHEKKLSHIADQILARKDKTRWVFIAGPSSAGKTTFSRRLAVHMRVNGLRPVTIECDNYFVNREDTPVDAQGHVDFEHIDAIDHDLFNDHLEKLDRGEEIELPTFNFQEGRQEFHGNTLKLEEDQVVLIEGIHCLDPVMSLGIPRDHKFCIYISALTQLTLDKNNRLSTTDLRLIRRIIRDNRTRGHSALRTFELWPSVRRGEKRWIFPFQQLADVAFNSSLDYEFAVLKPFVAPLLAEIKPFHKEYAEARRLIDFLDMILTAPAEPVPKSSIIREFIGESSYH